MPLLLPLPPLLLLPLLLLLLPLLLLLLLAELDPEVHWPLSHDREQQSPKLAHVPPAPLQVAVDPPQTPITQSLLQQSATWVHDAPSALQVGEAHAPFWQLPLQQSAAD
jgi:hypothetical protein